MTPAKKAPAKKAPAKKAPAKKAPAKKAPAKKAPAKKAPAKKVAADETAPTEKAPTMGGPAMKSPAMKSPAKRSAASETTRADEPAFSVVADPDEDLWDADWDDLGSFADDPGPAGAGAHDDTAHHLANEGVELFQNAALELIAAARNALDAAEELVADPRGIGMALESLRDLASDALRAARPRHSRSDAAPGDDDDDFQAIRVEDD